MKAAVISAIVAIVLVFFLTTFFVWRYRKEEKEFEEEIRKIEQQEQQAKSAALNEELLRLRAEGLSFAKIAQKMGMSKTSVIRRIRKAQKV